ncbi:hypothetical protein Scep_030466 [Stephania cephalantha]|uniref:Uncharacterized protein n=1 Tax=Stephania cephalantha TaxID=152367 RepID=A0AAP0DZN1_9MAGN
MGPKTTKIGFGRATQIMEIVLSLGLGGEIGDQRPIKSPDYIRNGEMEAQQESSLKAGPLVGL